VTTLRFPDVAVSGDALLTIAATLGIEVTALALASDSDRVNGQAYDLKAGGWVYERADADEDQGDAAPAGALPPGVTGFPCGSRWGGAR
jgi:hypothetical protein